MLATFFRPTNILGARSSRLHHKLQFLHYKFKMSAWRAAGLNYINYSNIAARVLRNSLKSDKRVEAARRNESHIKFVPWTDGKPAWKTRPGQ